MCCSRSRRRTTYVEPSSGAVVAAPEGLLAALGADVAGAGAVVAGVGTGAAEVGAAALALGALGALGALSAGFALATGAAGAAFALLAGVCAWTADANEIIPATVDNQKALLRRITTLNLCGDENRHRVASVPGTKTRASNGAPSSARHLPLREASRQVGFSQFFARLREPGGNAPARVGRSQISHTLSQAVDRTLSGRTRGRVRRPAARRSRLAGAGPHWCPSESLRNAVSCGKHGPSATVRRPDRTADRTPPWDVLIGQRP